MYVWRKNVLTKGAIPFNESLNILGYGGRSGPVWFWGWLVESRGVHVRDVVRWNTVLCRVPGGDLWQDNEPQGRKIKLIISQGQIKEFVQHQVGPETPLETIEFTNLCVRHCYPSHWKSENYDFQKGNKFLYMPVAPVSIC